MLYSLHVKNLALISEQEIEFSRGLNILTGETGAGKSVIIGSVNLALGAKADASLIRTGEDYALVELVFGLENDQQRSLLQKMDIPVEDDTLVIQRKIMDGRSISKVGGETVTARQLREIAEILINIHGQNDHQELLHRKKHMDILDGYLEQELAGLFCSLSDNYVRLKSLEKDLEQAGEDEASRAREQDLLEYEVNEIEQAQIIEGEDEQLEKDYRKMVNSKKISEAAYAAAAMTGSSEGGESASDMVGRAVRELTSVSSYDEGMEDLLSQITDIDNLLSDFNHSLSRYMDDLTFDDEKFRTCEDRLDLINHLKDKYGPTLTDVMASLDEKRERLDILMNFEEHKQKLENELKECKKEVLSLCKKISGIRKKGAKELSEKLIEALVDLNFLDVKFEIRVDSDENSITSRGYDDVEFMISTNPGEELRPLDRIASGGELSRIMLAIKTVAADRDDISTLIFDEIDAGISGKTAWKVSKKLGLLSRDHQIICITHLPQIAAMADSHFLIEKGLSDGRTVTAINKLSKDQSVRELARLLGSDEITDTAISNAEEMRKMAEESKRGN